MGAQSGAMNAVASAPLLLGMVEDDPHFSAGVVALLRRQPEVRMVATYEAATPMLSTAQKAHRHKLAPPWDLLLMDIGLPDMDGIEATHQLKALFPAVQVIVFTVFEEPVTVLSAICAGANGYLLKSAAAEELIGALTSFKQQAAPLSGRIANTLIELVRRSHGHHIGPQLPRDLGLTLREIEVLRGLVDGLSYREIGERLNISQDTVRSHIRKIYTTLQVHSVAEAVTFALRHGLA
jgi:DNA-binding NarL/FixJ family response regulator